MSDRVTHYMRTNSAARVPRRLIVLDSESYRNRRKTQETHKLRLAVASFDRLGKDGRPLKETEWLETADAPELWRWVASKTAASHRTVLFAHNLAYDLRITRALEELPGLGFTCKGIALTSFSCWARFHDGKRSLWLCDSLSWLPVPVERLAALQGLKQARLPGERDAASRWVARCRSDVTITRAAMLRVLAWLHDDDLGDFRLTGAAQSQAAFRHRFLAPKSLLVHDQGDALAAERRAAHAGRCEAWRHGEHRGDVVEWDFAASYATIAAQHELPVRLIGRKSSLTLDRAVRLAESYDVLADCTITTRVPVVPASVESRTLWPVGTFETTLWQHEWLSACESGAEVAIRRVWLYRRAPVLQEWARWVLAGLAGEPPGDDPLVRVVLKEWSRALIGRFGLRYAELTELGEGVGIDFALYPVRDAETGLDSTYLQLGRELYEQGERIESRSSMPQVMGAVMSIARMRLWRTMGIAGLGNVLYVDTDGLLVDAQGNRELAKWTKHGHIPGLRRKSAYRGAVIRGPRNLDVGEQRRVSGVPRKAEQLSPGVFKGEVWESLPASLRRRRPDRVIVTDRMFTVAEVDPRRLHGPDGATAPIVLTA